MTTSGQHPPVVTLASLYGAGGSVVGPRVAERLGVPFLDRAIPETVAKQTGLPEHAIADVDEQPRTAMERLVASLGRSSTVSGGAGGSAERLDMQERGLRAYIEEFLARASVSGGVALGRGGMVVLRSVPWALHVHLGGPREARLQQRMTLEGIDHETAERRRKVSDRTRMEYVRRAYGVDGEDPSLYHLMIDSTALDLDTCADIIVAASRARDPAPGTDLPGLRSRNAGTARHGDPGTQVPRRPLAVRAGRGWGRAADQGWQDGLPAGARQMPVPASYNDVFPDPEVHDHVGDVWYETLARVPARWAGERIVLRFGSATHRAVVWVNGRQVAEHEGGYTPFEADVTGVVEPGAENRVTVVVNNVLTWQSIPPGYVEQTPDGPRQHYFHDFFNYAGLHRPVWLYTTPGAHITDVTVVAGLAGATGTVDYRVETAGADGLQVRVMLTDADGAEAARATGGAGQLTVPDARPWRPGEGYLYDLAVELWGDGERAGGCVLAGDRHPDGRGRRRALPHQRRAVLFPRFGKHEDSRRARQGPRQRVHGP